jgi:hypothetical protein
MSIKLKLSLSRISFFLMFLLSLYCFQGASLDKPGPTLKTQKVLSAIYLEIVDFGGYEGQAFIKREFWMNLDGKDANKEEHIVAMRHNDGNILKFTLQVTYFTPDKGHRFIRYAQETKVILCCITDEALHICQSDYSDNELRKVLPDILKGIQNKKKLLKLVIRKKN